MSLTLTSVLLGTSRGCAEGTGLECVMGRHESDQSCDVDCGVYQANAISNSQY